MISSTSLNAVWSNVGRDTVTSRGLESVDAARIFALLTVSMNESILTSHSSKFIYGYWRPVATAIRRAAEDMNDATEADTSWTPLLVTPSVPVVRRRHGVRRCRRRYSVGARIRHERCAVHRGVEE